MNNNRLAINKVHDIPLSEVSGLGQRRVPGNKHQILAVGDRKFEVVVVHPSDGEDWHYETIALGSVLKDADAEKSSEWEAADSDTTGRVFMLQESPGRIYVADRDLKHIECVIELTLDEDQRRELNWDADSNARAEGLVLLRNGHVLIAKEKEPPLFLEFGARGEDAQGVQPDLLFGSIGEFPLPQEQKVSFELLKTWSLDKGSGITDISDMAAAPNAGLYLLSDESRCIARAETNLSHEETQLSVREMWELPEELEQPEGLVIRDGMVPLVAIDRDEQAENLFVMEPLT